MLNKADYSSDLAMPLRNKDRVTDPGLLLVVSGPSGSGKSTLCRAAMTRLNDLEFSVSFTTRPPRKGEQEGRDYFFVDDARFDQMVEEGAFVEWAQVHNNKYGTSLAFIESRTKAGASIVLDIDSQGARQIKDTFPNAIFIFCVAPSRKCLENRLRGRNTDTSKVIRQRLENAIGEIRQAVWYDYIVVNDVFETALLQFVSIIAAEGCRRERAPVKTKELLLEYGID